MSSEAYLELKPVRTAPQTEEEKKFAQKKCVRCGGFYVNVGVCHYHPGKFIRENVMKGIGIGWSCCNKSEKGGVPVPNMKAWERNCPGCCTKKSHKEDKKYTATASLFPFTQDTSTTSEKDTDSTSKKVDPSKPIESSAKAPKKASNGNIKHAVQKTDTLVGLSLKYGVSAEAIRKANNLYGDDIFFKVELLIPPGTVDPATITPSTFTPTSLSAKLREFQQQTSATLEESKFYLLGANEDIDSALKTYAADKKWEESKTKS